MAKSYQTKNGACNYWLRIHGELYAEISQAAQSREVSVSSYIAQIVSAQMKALEKADSFVPHPDAICFYLKPNNKNVTDTNRARQVKMTIEQAVIQKIFGVVEHSLSEDGYNKPAGFDEAMQLPEDGLKACEQYPAYRNYRKMFDKRCREVFVSLLVSGVRNGT